MQAATLMTGVKVMLGAMALTVGLTGAAAAQQVERQGQPGPGVAGGGTIGSGGPGGQVKIAWDGGPGKMGPLGGLLGVHPELPLPALNLTDAQREQVRTILQGHREEGQALMKRGHTAMEALRTSTEGTIDEGAAAQQGQALGAAIAEAAVLRSRVRSEIMAILTPDQQAVATKIQVDRELRMKQFRTKRDDRRPVKTPEL